ncbi:MAG: stage III sporulation protein AB [Ruminococcus sp.]|nr:stage III sporulation protein AB [Ruminococcus sp.]
MLRLTAAVLLTIAGTLWGWSRAAGLDRRLVICREAEMLLQSCDYLIRSRADDVYAICRELKRGSGFGSLSFISQLPDAFIPGHAFSDDWRNAVSGQDDMPPELSGLLIRFGSALGTSDITGQLSAIAVFSEELSHMTAGSEEDRRRLGRLYRTVGILTGMMAGIIVI